MDGQNGNVLERTEVDGLMKPVYEATGIRPQKVVIDVGSNKGDGYLSFLTRVDVVGEDDQEIHVVLKAAPRSAEFRRITPLRNAYLREMLFYESVVPTFRHFQTVTCPVRKPFHASAKFYHACKDDMREVLVMENIRTRGFRLWDRMKYMDHQHIEMVLRNYGRFHAVSYAMQQHDPETYSTLTKQMEVEVFRLDNVDPVMFEVFDSAANKIKQLFRDDPVASKRLEGFNMTKIWEKMMEEPGDFPTICHGDCWVNNMMFKYDDITDPKKPTDICMLDFQIMRISSPILDLSYFFYVSAPKAFLDQLDKYLRIYHDSLSEALHEMQCQVPITFEELKQQWKQYSKFGYNMSLVVSKIMMTEGDEILDLANLCETQTFADVFDKEIKHEDFINIKLTQLTQHMLDNDFL